jgi:hypothetical protein
MTLNCKYGKKKDRLKHRHPADGGIGSTRVEGYRVQGLLETLI